MSKTFAYPSAVVDVSERFPNQRWVYGKFGDGNSAQISIDPADPILVLWTARWCGKVTLTPENMRALATALLQGADELDDAVAAAKQ